MWEIYSWLFAVFSYLKINHRKIKFSWSRSIHRLRWFIHDIPSLIHSIYFWSNGLKSTDKKKNTISIKHNDKLYTSNMFSYISASRQLQRVPGERRWRRHLTAELRPMQTATENILKSTDQQRRQHQWASRLNSKLEIAHNVTQYTARYIILSYLHTQTRWLIQDRDKFIFMFFWNNKTACKLIRRRA
jgi:hypothetical protein